MSKWNGNGLPPVGEVCEVNHPNGNFGYIWLDCEILAHKRIAGTDVAVYWTQDGEADARVDACFRPLKSVAERKRDEAVFQIEKDMADSQRIESDYAERIARHLHSVGYQKANKLTDEQIVSYVDSANFWRGAKWARAQILGEES